MKCHVNCRADGRNDEKRVCLLRVMLPDGVVGYFVSSAEDLEGGQA